MTIYKDGKPFLIQGIRPHGNLHMIGKSLKKFIKKWVVNMMAQLFYLQAQNQTIKMVHTDL